MEARGLMKSIRLEPGGGWGSILALSLEQNYMRSLLEILVLLPKAGFDVKKKKNCRIT